MFFLTEWFHSVLAVKIKNYLYSFMLCGNRKRLQDMEIFIIIFFPCFLCLSLYDFFSLFLSVCVFAFECVCVCACVYASVINDRNYRSPQTLSPPCRFHHTQATRRVINDRNYTSPQTYPRQVDFITPKQRGNNWVHGPLPHSSTPDREGAARQGKHTNG